MWAEKVVVYRLYHYNQYPYALSINPYASQQYVIHDGNCNIHRSQAASASPMLLHNVVCGIDRSSTVK